MGEIKKIILILLIFFHTSIYAITKIPDVVLSDSISSLSFNQSAGGILKTIDQSDIVRSGAHSLSSFLQGQMGIEVNQFFGGDPSRFSINLRGFGDNAGSNVLILVNGVPYINADLKTVNIDQIPINQVKAVQIEPDSASVLYGDQAVGGVINIITEQSFQKKIEADYRYGSYATRFYHVNFQNRYRKKLSYRISTAYEKSHHYRQHNQGTQKQINFTTNYKMHRGDVTVHYQNLEDRLQYPGALTYSQMREDRRQATDHLDFNQQNAQFLQASFSHLFSQWHFSLNTDYRKELGHGILSLPFREKRHMADLIPMMERNYFFKSFLLSPIIGFQATQGNYEYIQTGYHFRGDQIQIAEYIHFNFLLLKYYRFVIGSRLANMRENISSDIANNMDRMHPHDSVWVNDIGFYWMVNRSWQWLIKASGNYRFPKVDENTLTLNNTPLKTQTGMDYQTGFVYKVARLSSYFGIYQLNLKNEIVFIPLVTNRFGYNENLDRTKRQGLLLDLNYSVTTNWSLSSDYNFVNAKFSDGINEGNRIPFVPQNLLQLSATYLFHQDWSFLSQMIFTSNRYPSNDVANEAREMPSYAIFNVGLTYEKKNYFMQLRINNIFNKYYNAYAIVTYQNGSPVTSYYPADGVNGEISVGVRLS